MCLQDLPLPNTTSPSDQAGASAIEFSIIAIPLFLIGLGSVEIAQWFHVKQAVSLALAEAGRAGITRHGEPAAIEQAFEYALRPLFASNTPGQTEIRMKTAFEKRRATLGLPPWQIEVLLPSSDAFRDFADKELAVAGHFGQTAINNDYQAEQDARYRAIGWRDGRGPRSGLSIYQANTLVLHATYLHEPIVPGMKGLLRMLRGNQNLYSGRAMALGGYLPIRQELVFTMHSHPVQWPSLANKKVIRQADSAVNAAPSLGAACQGMWCLGAPAASGYEAPAVPSDDPATPQDDDNIPPDPGPVQSSPGGTGDSQPGTDPNTDIIVRPDDPACGVTLCCVAT